MGRVRRLVRVERMLMLATMATVGGAVAGALVVADAACSAVSEANEAVSSIST